jgi:hypothetical protein
VSSVPDLLAREPEGGRQSQLVADFLAALAGFTALIALAWHPLRLLPAATVVALVASALAGRTRRLPKAAVLLCAFCFFLGMTIAVVTSRPLW